MGEPINSIKNGQSRSILRPFLFFVLTYLIWHVHFMMLRVRTGFVELLFVVTMLFYLLVLLISLVFMNKDLRKPLSQVFKVRSFSFTLVALVFSIIFQAVWFAISFNIGGVLEQQSPRGIVGYEFYSFYSVYLALILYFLLLIFGAFVDEVAFRGYIQSRIGSGGGRFAGVIVASLLFSIQSLHVFQPDQILNFLQTDFIYLMCFNIFVGYFFLKTRGDIWSVFAFHALTRIIDVSLPVKITYAFPYSKQFVTIASFVFLVFILRLVPITELISPENAKEEIE